MSSEPIDEARLDAKPPARIAFRLAIWYAALFTASAILLAALTYLLLARSLVERDHEIIRSTLVRYATQYQQGGLDALNTAVRTDALAGRHEPLFVRVLGPDAGALFYSMPSGWLGFDPATLPVPQADASTPWTSVPARGGASRLEIDSAYLTDGTLFQVGKSTESRDETLRQFRAVLGIALLVMIGVGLTGGALLTRSALAPLRRLIETVRSIIRTGRLDARVPLTEPLLETGPRGVTARNARPRTELNERRSASERSEPGFGAEPRLRKDTIDELGALFNDMLDRIASLIDGMRGSLDNVAHDLRTPMMRLRGTAELALQTQASPEALREALTGCIEESEQVLAMLDTLMDISEAETGVMKLQREPVAVADLLADAADLYVEVAEDKGVELRVTPSPAPASAQPPSTVEVDRNRMRRALANLLDNAVKYTPAGGQVTLAAESSDSRVRISVRDTGPGIAPQDLDRIWDRLYRGDASRSERGLGLGLSLVRAIVRAHGGQVSVTSEPGHGAAFTIELARHADKLSQQA